MVDSARERQSEALLNGSLAILRIADELADSGKPESEARASQLYELADRIDAIAVQHRSLAKPEWIYGV